MHAEFNDLFIRYYRILESKTLRRSERPQVVVGTRCIINRTKDRTAQEIADRFSFNIIKIKNMSQNKLQEKKKRHVF